MPSPASVVVRSAAVLGRAWLGDALIYVAMPLHPAAFGVALPWVGLVLSLNRIVRILAYGWIEPLSRRIGPRRLVIAGSAAAAVSTLVYGLASGSGCCWRRDSCGGCAGACSTCSPPSTRSPS